MSELKVLIVGGGIGGLTSAIALGQRGFHVEIAEKDPDWSVYGIGIIQQSNVIRAVAALGIIDDYLDAGYGYDHLEVYKPDGERLALLNIEPRPDLYGAAAGSMDFYHPEGGYTTEVPYVNSTRFLAETIKAVYERGAAVEYEVVEASALNRLLRLADEGVFDHGRENVWLLHGGGFGAVPATPRAVLFSIEEGWRLFPNAIWGVVATGRDMFKIDTLGLSLGCNTVRVGFEDNIYLPNGEAAEHNGQQVDAIAEIARIYGREPATVDEARQRFQLH